VIPVRSSRSKSDHCAAAPSELSTNVNTTTTLAVQAVFDAMMNGLLPVNMSDAPKTAHSPANTHVDEIDRSRVELPGPVIGRGQHSWVRLGTRSSPSKQFRLQLSNDVASFDATSLSDCCQYSTSPD
jgi:hypothetical protein